jgi:hypothetical protein
MSGQLADVWRTRPSTRNIMVNRESEEISRISENIRAERELCLILSAGDEPIGRPSSQAFLAALLLQPLSPSDRTSFALVDRAV